MVNKIKVECKAMTRHKTKCKCAAVLNGYCITHYKANVLQDTKRNKKKREDIESKVQSG